MSSLILCNKKRAKQPYEVSRIHCRIYTLEELCYYLSNNLYLIDYTIVNERLCDWIEAELGLLRLAEQLRTMLQKHSSEERFVMRILSSSSIYTAGELQQIQNILDRLKKLNDRNIKRIIFWKTENSKMRFLCISPFYMAIGMIRWKMLFMERFMRALDRHMADNFFTGKRWRCMKRRFRHTKSRRSSKHIFTVRIRRIQRKNMNSFC